MSDPAYPDVPNAEGVPPVLRRGPLDAGVPGAQQPMGVEALTKDAPGLTEGSQVRWGIFGQRGALALEPDNISAVEYQREYQVAEYPIEQGGFESYNKVATPFDIRVTMTKGGKISERKDFLDQIEQIMDSLDLYTIVTPERSYQNANIVRTDYRRSGESGASLVTVELRAIEIRTQASIQFSSSTATAGAPKAPSGANPVNNGSVQALTPAQERLFEQGLPIDIGP